jgi:hypothetical protein
MEETPIETHAQVVRLDIKKPGASCSAR